MSEAWATSEPWFSGERASAAQFEREAQETATQGRPAAGGGAP
jgi:hypothetical protein